MIILVARLCLWPSCVIVQSKSVGPAQVGVDQNLSVQAVQVRSLNLRNVAPVSPEQEPACSSFKLLEDFDEQKPN